MSAHHYYCSLLSHKSKIEKAYLKETFHEEKIIFFSLYKGKHDQNFWISFSFLKCLWNFQQDAASLLKNLKPTLDNRENQTELKK